MGEWILSVLTAAAAIVIVTPSAGFKRGRMIDFPDFAMVLEEMR